MQLPSSNISKLIIGVVLVVTLFISGDIILKKIKKEDTLEVVDADLILQRQTTDNSSVDPDGDGLFNWQETLYGSDPEKSDTDGDGTNDGDEIKDSRDPQIPGPDDKLIKINDLIEPQMDSKFYTKGSLTDTLSIDLFTQYLSLKKDNKLNSEEGYQMIDDLTQKVLKESKIENKYSASNLKIVDSSEDNLKEYGKNFALISLDYYKKIQNASLVSKDVYTATVSGYFIQMANQLSLIKVPDVATNVHVQIINKINNRGVFLLEISNNYETDPVKSLLAIQKIKTNDEGEKELYSLLAKYFKNNGIIFDDNDVIKYWNLYE